MSIPLNYHHLFYFRTIANLGGISKASQHLRLGQPTLSAQLRQLEDSLGVALFERKNRKMILTEAGRVTLAYANTIFKSGVELIEVLRGKTHLSEMYIQIGAIDGVSKVTLLKLVQAIRAQFSATVTVLEGAGDQLIKDLSLFKIDLMVSNFVPHRDRLKGFQSRAVGRLPVIICGAAKFAHHRNSSHRNLNECPFILPTTHSRLRSEVEAFFHRNKWAPKIVAETQDARLQELLATSGAGLIVCTRDAVLEQLKRGELLEILEIEGVYEEVFFTSASRTIEHPIVAKLMLDFELR